jgi:hypothetical protein
VIKTRADLLDIPKGEVRVGDFVSSGEVLDGSFIGDSPFCPGGTFRDVHGPPEIGLVDRTFRCPDGRLRIGFSPGEPHGRTQAGPWRVISGTGAFKRWRGYGQMEMKYKPGTSATERSRDVHRDGELGPPGNQATQLTPRGTCFSMCPQPRRKRPEPSSIPPGRLPFSCHSFSGTRRYRSDW